MDQFNAATVAIGETYRNEAERLRPEFPGLLMITEAHPRYVRESNDQLLDALTVKTDFARFLPDDAQGPVFLFDADLMPLVPNPLATFEVDPETDVALVPYPGSYHYADSERQAIYEKVGANLNSGFVYFRDLSVARALSQDWKRRFLDRMSRYGVSRKNAAEEYDEPALLETLANGAWSVGWLEAKWNLWYPDETVEPIFIQRHDGLSNPYLDIPFERDFADQLFSVVKGFSAETKAALPFERVAYWLERQDFDAARAAIERTDVSDYTQEVKDAKARLLAHF